MYHKINLGSEKMAEKLYYLKIIGKEKHLNYDREFEQDELDLIKESNEILGAFNSFCDYYYIFDSNLKDLENYLKKVESLENKVPSIIDRRNMINEVNKLVINFAVAFRNYLDHYEIKIKEIAGKTSKEYKDFKYTCSKYFDKFFEYRFLSNLRHYNVHYKIPVTKVFSDLKSKKRKFIIEKNKLQEWNGWKSNIEKDIESLKSDIDVSDFIKSCKRMINQFNKDISYYNEPEVLGALRILKKYERKNETPYICNEVILDGKKELKIVGILDEYITAINNIFKLGVISCASYTKDFGFQFFDPFNLMFTKEQKEKLGLS